MNHETPKSNAFDGGSFNVDALTEQLLGTWSDVRRKSRALTAMPELQGIPGLSMAEHRARVTLQLRRLTGIGAVGRAYPKSLGGHDDHGGNLVSFEELIVADPSLQIKAGVQWGLFGAAVLYLGNEQQQQEWLPGILSLEIPGIFAMTETGHGSDVQSIATTAIFDEEQGDFVLNTPHRAAWKDYLGNAAVDGIAAIVFAQLITHGENHGVHAFYVPIRTTSGKFLPGIGGNDNGPKGGLNGLDNGSLHFTDVRVPRANLLNRYGNVTKDGAYSSPIESAGRRFFTMLGTLVQGRVSLDGAATTASSLALAIAVRYGNERHQFSPHHEAGETVLLDYPHHQRRLIPRLATVYAQTFAHDDLLVHFDSVFSGANDTPETREELETKAAALKALSTWGAIDTIQAAREACGGSGYLAENRLVGLRADLDVYATFEGDNTVLMQLVGRRLLANHATLLKASGVAGALRSVVSTVAEDVIDNAGIRRLRNNLSSLGSVDRAARDLRDANTQARLLRDRLNTMVNDLGTKLWSIRRLTPAEAARAALPHQSKIIELGRVYGELLQWEAFTCAVTEQENTGARDVLEQLRQLFGLELISQNLAWYLENGKLSALQARALRAEISRLIGALRPNAQRLVDAFGFKQEHLRATISSGVEQERYDEANQAKTATKRADTDNETPIRAEEDPPQP